MKIITLVENSCGHEDCIAEHGLSVYIETRKHRLLLDTGQSDAVVKNAEVLGVDLSLVDTVVLSHGHYDHSGGIVLESVLTKKSNNTSSTLIVKDISVDTNLEYKHFDPTEYTNEDE